jgi:hypothetical protein
MERGTSSTNGKFSDPPGEGAHLNYTSFESTASHHLGAIKFCVASAQRSDKRVPSGADAASGCENGSGGGLARSAAGRDGRSISAVDRKVLDRKEYR